MDSQYFVAGVTVIMVATVVMGFVGAIGSGYPLAVLGPRSGVAPVYAGMIASIVIAMPSEAGPEETFSTVIAGMMVATAVTGLTLFLLGHYRLGGLVRYIPYPVMGGFFAGIGYIFLVGGISVATNLPLDTETLARQIEPSVLMLSIPAAAFATITYIVNSRFGHWAIMPGAIVVAMVAFYVVLHISGLSMDDARLAGYLPDLQGATVSFPVLGVEAFEAVNWSAILPEVSAMATIAILSAIMLLLDVSGAEIVTNTDIDPDKELKVAGAANILNGAIGGFAGVHSASETALALKLGAKSRLMGVTFAAVTMVAIVIGTDMIGAVPSFILGGLLGFLGLGFFVDWVWKTRKDLPLMDYLVILAILVVIATIGLLEGVAFGFVVAVILFVITYSRLGVIKAEISGADHTSHVVRKLETREILNAEGARILIVKLQGFIFFGTADSMWATIRTRLTTNADTSDRQAIDYLVLDFEHVSRLDSSAIQTFLKLLRLAKRSDLALILTALNPREHARLAGVNFFSTEKSDDETKSRLAFDSLDEGVAWCETDILAHHEFKLETMQEPLNQRLAQMLENEAAADAIAPYFEKITAEAGTVLFRQGDLGDSLYILNSGCASVSLTTASVGERVIRIYLEGTLLGEMALYSQEPRSATVRIDEDSVLFKLPIDHFVAMQEELPLAAGLFHAHVVRLLSERLARANRELQQLS